MSSPLSSSASTCTGTWKWTGDPSARDAVRRGRKGSMEAGDVVTTFKPPSAAKLQQVVIFSQSVRRD
jgi:hypothetical protein